MVTHRPHRTWLSRAHPNKNTGEIRPVHQDPARHLYGEAGQEGMAWGTKFAIASVRSPMSGHRVVLGVEHVPPRGGGGEDHGATSGVLHPPDVSTAKGTVGDERRDPWSAFG